MKNSTFFEAQPQITAVFYRALTPSQTFLKWSCWNLLQKQLHNYIFYISLAAIEVDLPKAVNACINHSWAYNGRRASPYLTWRTPPFLKLDRKSPPFSMELWPPKCRLIFFFSFRRQKYQPHYILMEFVCLACAWTIKSMGVSHSQKEDRVKNLHSGPKWFIYFLNLEFSLPIDTKKINLIRSKCNQIHSSQHLKCLFCVIHDYLVSKEQVLRTSTNKFWKIGFKMYLKNSC